MLDHGWLAVRLLAAGLLTGIVARVVTTDVGALVLLPASWAARGEDWSDIGRDATAEEIRAWDIDVMPDGTGLPPGSGTVAQGAVVYAQRCASCHGDRGQVGELPPSGEVLVGREPWFELGNPTPVGPRTVGNYWPYATTLFDYIRRAMPPEAPGSLGDGEVYSVAAWLLNENGIIAEDAVMDAQTLPAVRMPGLDLFVPDARPERL